MIIFWATEALPHPVTSLLPIALFPLLGLGVNYRYITALIDIFYHFSPVHSRDM